MLLFSLLNLATSLGLQFNSTPKVVISSHVVMLSATLLRTLWSPVVCTFNDSWKKNNQTNDLNVILNHFLYFIIMVFEQIFTHNFKFWILFRQGGKGVMNERN